MANYYLITIDASEDVLKHLEGGPDCSFGGMLTMVFETSAQNMHIRLGQHPPAAQPLTFADKTVGEFIGYHYDGSPTGYNGVAIPKIKPNMLVFTCSNSAFHELKDISASRIAQLARHFLETPSASIRSNGLIPVFYNNADVPTHLRILKIWPHREEDADKMIYCGDAPFCFSDDFTAVRLASEL